MSTREIEITKEEYDDNSEDWEERLIQKYGLNAAKIAASQRNFDGEKYTYDVWLREIWNAEDEAVYRPLRRKRLRLEAKVRRDKTRKRVFKPRLASGSRTGKPSSEEAYP